MRKKWLYTWITANQSAVCVSAAPAILSDLHVWHFWMFLPMLRVYYAPRPRYWGICYWSLVKVDPKNLASDLLGDVGNALPEDIDLPWSEKSCNEVSPKKDKLVSKCGPKIETVFGPQNCSPHLNKTTIRDPQAVPKIGPDIHSLQAFCCKSSGLIWSVGRKRPLRTAQRARHRATHLFTVRLWGRPLGILTGSAGFKAAKHFCCTRSHAVGKVLCMNPTPNLLFPKEDASKFQSPCPSHVGFVMHAKKIV